MVSLKVIGSLSEEVITQTLKIDLPRDRSPSELEMRRCLIRNLQPEFTSRTLIYNSSHQLRIISWHYLELQNWI